MEAEGYFDMVLDIFWQFLTLKSNNEIILGINHCNIPRIIQVIVECIMREGIDNDNVTAIRMLNICRHVQVSFPFKIFLSVKTKSNYIFNSIQTNQQMLQGCISILTPDQKDCLQKLLS